MSFMSGEGAVWSDRLMSNANVVARKRYFKQQEQIARTGVKLAAKQIGQRAALERRVNRDRAKDLAAQRASEIRMSNTTLKSRPRAGGSVLGGW